MSIGATDQTEVNALKLARLHDMAGALVDELHHVELDAPSRARLERLAYDSLVEVGSALPPSLLDELQRLVPPSERPRASDAELRVLWAQVLGWINGVALADRVDALLHLNELQRAEPAPDQPRAETARVATPYL